MTTLSIETLAHLRKVSTATLTTQLFKRGLRNAFLQGVRVLGRLDGNLVGPAFTLRNIPAREDIDHVGVFADPDHPQRRAIEIAPAGSVLVIDCRGGYAGCLGRGYSDYPAGGARRGGIRIRWRGSRCRLDRRDGVSGVLFGAECAA